MYSTSLSPAAAKPQRSQPSRRPPRPWVLAVTGILVAAVTGCSLQPPGAMLTQPATTAGTVAESPTPSPVAPAPALVPVPQLLAAKLAKVSRTGIGSSGVAVLAPDGSVLADRGADRPLAPASTMKVLTALAAIDLLGAEHRFRTKVVQPAPGKLVLVGGGDPLLAVKPSKSVAKPASLQALATATAAALATSGIKQVSLSWDASLFSGTGFSPSWKASWKSYTPRVSALVSGGGVVNQWQAQPDPAKAAAAAFAARLKAAGVKVRLAGSTKADANAAELAGLDSAPLRTIVARTLRLSDNLAADVLARHVAIASGQPATFAGGAEAIQGWLAGHGLWADGMRVIDGSGLARDARVTPAVLARAVQASLEKPEWSWVAAGLPVAGESGTLADRFDDKSEKVARGNVRAKTGTLVGVATLAGYLTTADGARLAFALMAGRTAGRNTAYNWLDRSAAAMVRCGCN